MTQSISFFNLKPTDTRTINIICGIALILKYQPDATFYHDREFVGLGYYYQDKEDSFPGKMSLEDEQLLFNWGWRNLDGGWAN